MTTFAATWCDGRMAVRRPASVEVEGEEVRISGDFAPLVVPRSALTPDDPMQDLPRTLHLADGGTLETDAHDAVEESWPTRGRIARVALFLESRWSASLCAVAAIASITWFIIVVALPTLAEPVAASLSSRSVHAIGQSTLTTLDRTILTPSQLPRSRIAEINARFDAFLTDEPDTDDFRIEFRRMPGANAFALPGGIIVVSDDMVALAATDDELLAVIAHEIGHERNHHGIRLVLQNSGLAVLVTALAGDAVGMTILAAALPSVLVQSRYSRQFEAEADEYAFAHLKRHGKSPRVFADVMRRLQQSEQHDDGEQGLVQYLSSHPATEERIRRAEEAQ
jgi:Zn-dependent protease with chaperone function